MICIYWPPRFPVLCSRTIFIDKYFLPPLVVVQVIDLIDQGPWESTKPAFFFLRCFPWINTDYYSEGADCCDEVSYEEAVYILIWLLFVFWVPKILAIRLKTLDKVNKWSATLTS